MVEVKNETIDVWITWLFFLTQGTLELGELYQTFYRELLPKEMFEKNIKRQ